ncbi:glycosyltransferase family 4 protein [filamentous cyanobacterium LEGE 11480]|uniref:Glycosyltransferase family 4 protein n=1 Tax=Romeriopsis navalis LEGE 11480 TaxID=2777977 RepID=A0A928VLZ5_9CYAN|nr:glycosyltransferase family 4 protein [Romeriopsis navalis]MBE9028807.1 glycosyltransferase family 4 protein [Romeriopsis navalis LEGE 11480]
MLMAHGAATDLTDADSHEAGQRRIMLFDLDVRGHHPGYIQHLISYWIEQQLVGHLDILVTPQFLQQHHNIVELAESAPQGNVEFVAITPAESAKLFASEDLEHSFKGRIMRGLQEWRLLRRYAAERKIDHCFVMYLDTLLLRLAMLPNLHGRLRCPLSTIYFRPILHYGNFSTYLPEGRENLWYWRDRFCLARLLQIPNLDTVFCLDPYAVEHINQVHQTQKMVYLPDPVQIYPVAPTQVEDLRSQLGIDPERQVFLLFGALSERKGLSKVMAALEELSPNLSQRLTLLLVGPVAADDRANLDRQVERVQQNRSIQIIRQHSFVTDEQIQPYFQLADVILAPYQRHIGMSAILVRAAAAQTPVLSSDFGLMGEITRRHRLGLAVDASQPAAIAQGMTQLLAKDPRSFVDVALMQQFAAQNNATNFASHIFESLAVRSANHAVL